MRNLSGRTIGADGCALNRLSHYMFIRFCACGVANRAENHVNGISSIHRCTGRAALAVAHTGVRISSVSRDSALSRPARNLELPAAFLHPLGRGEVPVLALRPQLVATLQADESLGELPLLPEHTAQVAVTLRMIGSQRDGLAVGSHRLGESTRSSKEIAEVVVGVDIIGLQLDRTPAGGDRLDKLALLAESQSKPNVSHAIIRFQGDGLAVGRHRLVESTRLSKVQSEVEVGVGILRLQLDGAPESGDCLIKVALLAEGRPETEVSKAAIGLQSDGMAVGDGRLVPPSGVEQGTAEVASHFMAVGPQRRRHGQESYGLFMLRRLAITKCHPEFMVDPEVCRESFLGTCNSARAAALAPRCFKPHFQHEQSFRRLLCGIDVACQLLHRLAVIFRARQRTPCRQGSESATESTCLSQAASGAFSKFARINQ